MRSPLEPSFAMPFGILGTSYLFLEYVYCSNPVRYPFKRTDTCRMSLEQLSFRTWASFVVTKYTLLKTDSFHRISDIIIYLKIAIADAVCLKRGTGRFSHIVLIPQPSDDPNDPFVFSRLSIEFCLTTQSVD